MDKTRALKVSVSIIERTTSYDYTTVAEQTIEASLPANPKAIGEIVTGQVETLVATVERLRGPVLPVALGLVSEQGTRPV